MGFLDFCYFQCSGHCMKLLFVLTLIFTIAAIYLHMWLSPLSTKAVIDKDRSSIYEWSLGNSNIDRGDASQDYKLDPEVQKRNISYGYAKQWVGFRHVTRVNCESSLRHIAVNKTYPKTVRRIFPGEFIQDARNCSRFRDTYGYQRYPKPSLEERDFPIAFVILFHQDLDQLHFLLRAIYRPHNVYCLSVDIKSSVEMLAATRSIAKCLPNVFVSSKLENIVYGGYSRLLADINCFRDLIEHPTPWRYAINSPGQQFPLRTNLEMVKILTLLNGTNDILGVAGDVKHVGRYTNKWKYDINEATGDISMSSTSEKHEPAPHGVDIIKCSAYGAFTRAFVHFVLHSNLSLDLLYWSRAVYSPDELYWATLNYNKVSPAPGGFQGIPANRPWLTAFSIWPWDNLPCHSKFVRQICIFSLDDLPLLVTSPALFANKFHINHDPMALHCLDQYIYNLTLLGEPRDTSYYQNHFSGR